MKTLDGNLLELSSTDQSLQDDRIIKSLGGGCGHNLPLSDHSYFRDQQHETALEVALLPVRNNWLVLNSPIAIMLLVPQEMDSKV